MTFEQAERKLLRIANGKYCSVEYERTYNEGKVIEQKCSLYVGGGNIHTERTWDEAFKSIKPKPVKLKIEKAPEADVK